MAKGKLSAEEMAQKYARFKSPQKKAKSESEMYLNATGDEDLNKEPKEPKEKKASTKGVDDATADIYGASPIQREYAKGIGMSVQKTEANTQVQELETVPVPTGFETPPIIEDNSFSGQPITDPSKAPKQPTKTAPSSRPNAITPPPATHFRNEQMDDMSNKQKNQSAQAMAKTMINMYCWLNEQGKKMAKFDEKDAQVKAIDGKFDFDVLYMQIQMPDGTIGTIKDFIDSVNDGAEEVFTVTDEFKGEVEPLLVNILAKNGWGMTDEQRLMYIVAEDALPKTMAIFQIRNTMNHILEVSMEQLAGQRKSMGHGATVAPPPPTREPEKETTKKETKKEEKTPSDSYSDEGLNNNPDSGISDAETVVDAPEKMVHTAPVINQSEKVAQQTAKRGRTAKKDKEKDIRESGELFPSTDEEIEN